MKSHPHQPLIVIPITKKLYEQALSTIDQKDALIRELRSRLAAVEDDNRACHRLMKKAHDLLADPASGKEQVHG